MNKPITRPLLTLPEPKDKLPPLPWSYETNAPVGIHEGKGFVYLLDANGRKIGTVWGNPDEKMAIVKLVMDASDMMHSLNQAIAATND